MALQRVGNEYDEYKNTGPDNALQSPLPKSKSLSSLVELERSEIFKVPQPPVEKRPIRFPSRRRRRTLSAGLRGGDALFKPDAVGEKQLAIFNSVCDVSQQFLLGYLSACESVQSVSVRDSTPVPVTVPSTNSMKERKTPMEAESVMTSGSVVASSQSMGYDQVHWQLESLSARFSQWQAQHCLTEWPTVIEGRENLLGVGARMFSSLMHLAENEINLFEHTSSDFLDILPELREVARKLRSLVDEGKKLKPSDPASERERSATADVQMTSNNVSEEIPLFSDLDAMVECMGDLEKPLRMAKRTLVSRRRSPSPWRNKLPLGPIETESTFQPPRTAAPAHSPSIAVSPPTTLSPSDSESLSGPFPPHQCVDSERMPPHKSIAPVGKHVKFTRERVTGTSPELPTKRRMTTTPSSADKSMSRPLKSALKGSSTCLKPKPTDTPSGSVRRMFLCERLEKLAGLRDLWQKTRVDLDVERLTTNVPPFAVVLISTDPAEIDRYRPAEIKLVEDEPELTSSPDESMDRISRSFSIVRLVDANLPNDVAEELINRVSDEYRPVFDELPKADDLPGFSDAYTVMESCLALLESVSGWVLHAQTSQRCHATSLLPIIQRCILDRLFETSSKFPVRIGNIAAFGALGISKVLYVAGILRRSVQRLKSIKVFHRLEPEWEMLQQPLQEVFKEFDALYDDASRSLVCTVRQEEGGAKGPGDQRTELGETLDLVDGANRHDKVHDVYAASIPDMVTLPPVHLLFHFTPHGEQSDRLSHEYTALSDPFITEPVKQFMFEHTHDADKHKSKSSLTQIS
ncbi:hypothetical protein DL768_010308 [Monosporascus sp. mg162]|nr:hypothetical protein DL768_010308 [Monosporascus sp. mg162]